MTNDDSQSQPSDPPASSPSEDDSFTLRLSDDGIWRFGLGACVVVLLGAIAQDPFIAMLGYFAAAGMLALSFPHVLHQLRRRAPSANEQLAVLTVLGGFGPLAVPLGVWSVFAATWTGLAFLPVALAWGALAIHMGQRPPGRWRRPFLWASAAWAALGLVGAFVSAFA